MGWREEVLFDQQFFGPPSAGLTEAQQRIVRYAVGAVGGVLTTLNFIHYLKLEIDANRAQIRDEINTYKARGKGD